MDIFIFAVFAFVMGSVFASFSGSLAYRLETDRKLLKRQRSFCPKCEHTLSPFDLIPVFSYLILRGKCRYCHKSISANYFWAEIFGGLLWVIVALGIVQAPGLWNLKSLILLTLMSILLTYLLVVDLFFYILPHSINLAMGILMLVIFNFSIAPEREWGVVIGFGFLTFLWLITKFRGIGMGDLSLGVWFGYGLGSPAAAVGLFFSFVIGAVVGVLLIALGRKKIKQAVPFGPFLIFGFAIALFWGDQIARWYLRALHL